MESQQPLLTPEHCMEREAAWRTAETKKSVGHRLGSPVACSDC